MSLRAALAALPRAGVQHVMAAPEDRDIETVLKTVERFVKAGKGYKPPRPSRPDGDGPRTGWCRGEGD